MNTTTTKIAGEAMTNEQILALADQHRIDYRGDYSRSAPEHEADLLNFVRALLESKQASALEAELASMTRMFHAACSDLGLVNEALGLDPDDGGAAPILEAIAELKSARDQWVDANYTAPAQSCGDAEQADEAVTYEDVVSICDAHGIDLPVEYIEHAVDIANHARAALTAEKVAAEPVAIVRDNPDDYGTIIEATRPLEVGTQLYLAAPQQPAQSAEQDERAASPTDDEIIEDATGAFGRSREYSNCFGEPSERSLVHFVRKYMARALLAAQPVSGGKS